MTVRRQDLQMVSVMMRPMAPAIIRIQPTTPSSRFAHVDLQRERDDRAHSEQEDTAPTPTVIVLLHRGNFASIPAVTRANRCAVSTGLE